MLRTSLRTARILEHRRLRIGCRWIQWPALPYRAWAQVILFISIIVGVADPALAQSTQNIQAQVGALLGAYEGSSPAQWRSLGDAAIPVLEAVVADDAALPTRRARALAGLAALSSGSATMQSVANSASEPLIVRMSAVRGLAQILPESDLIPALRPLLNDPQYQMRGITAQALSNTPAGCAEIAGMAQQETPAWRARYARRCADPSNSLNQPPAGGGKTVVDYFSSGAVGNVFDPSGHQVLACPPLGPPRPGCAFFFGLPGGFSTVLPYSPTLPFASGRWTFDFGAGPGDTVGVQARLRQAQR